MTRAAGVSRAGLVLACLLAAVAAAGEREFTGFAEMSTQSFPSAGRSAGQPRGSIGSVAVQSELYWQADGGRLRFSAVGFGRADSADDARTHADLREANIGYAGDGWDVNVGINKVFWGVTESRHLVDVINQADLVEDIDEEDKLGQPMVNLNLDRDYGRFELYVLPRFRKRTFPGPDGRLRSPLPVDADAAIFEARDGERHRDVSLRYSHYVGSFDIGVSAFDGTSREPAFRLGPAGDRLLPVYEQMRQFGIDLQMTRAAWLWKLEAISRDASSDSFAAAVTGVEYTFYGLGGGSADVGVLLELLYDGRSGAAPPTVFDRDVFLGTRIAFLDSSDTSVLAGVVFDVDTREAFLNVEASRRFGESFTVDARLRAFGSARPGEPSYWLGRDDYVELALSWFY